MARDNTGQVDIGHGTRIQASVHTGATSDRITSVYLQPGGKSDNFTGDRISFEEGGDSSLNGKGGGLHQQHLLGSQERREVEIDPQFESLESVRDSRTFQDGGHSLCE